jgi:hypothetical protein
MDDELIEKNECFFIAEIRFTVSITQKYMITAQNALLLIEFGRQNREGKNLKTSRRNYPKANQLWKITSRCYPTN